MTARIEDGGPAEAGPDLVDRLLKGCVYFDPKWLFVGDGFDQEATEALMSEAAAEITRLRAENAGMLEAAQTALNALDTLAFVHDGNPSDAMADMPAVDYARHILWEVRRSAKAAASDARSALSNATTPETGGGG